MKRLEAFAYGIMMAEGWKPGSRSWRNCNPGNMRSSRWTAILSGGYAVFPTFVQGFLALEWDLGKKCTGATSTGLGPSNTVAQLCKVWTALEDGEELEDYIAVVCKWTRCAPDTPLSWFTVNNA